MRKYVFILISIFTCNVLYANNIAVENITYQSPNKILFELSWDNSWNIISEPNNYDAVWLFLKYRQNSNWHHLKIDSLNISVKLIHDNADFYYADNQTGILVYKNSIGTGDMQNVLLEYTFNNNQISEYDEIKIFGIEMVYIPQEPFYFGDAISANSFCNNNKTGGFFVNSENIIYTDVDTNSLSVITDLHIPQIVPNDFPKGYNAFYCMKYEISQEQYVNFLNTLTTQQQENRTMNSPFSEEGSNAFGIVNTSRNSIIINISATNNFPAVYACNANGNQIYNEIDDGQNVAMNWLSWNDLAAYLDWAGLRPMTEMEYEKVCRGNKKSVAGEFAWGTEFVVDANDIENAFLPNERVTNNIPENYGLANHGYEGVFGPLRCGFAANQNSTRLASGATYYGVMEMSGNVWEQCVAIDSVGIIFVGNLGNGLLDENGNANVLTWPKENAYGIIVRGGAWNSGIYEVGTFRDLAVSDRFYYDLIMNERKSTIGGRGVLQITGNEK